MFPPKIDDQLLLNMLDSMPEPIVYHTPIWQESNNEKILVDFEIIYCNDGSVRMTGIAKEVLIGQRVKSMIASDDDVRAKLFAQLKHVIETGEETEVSYFNPVLKKHFNLLRKRVNEGVFTIGKNITPQIRLQKESERQVDLTNSILDASINGVFAMEAIRNESGAITDFIFIKINQRFADLVGKKEDEIIGQNYLSILSPSKEIGLFEMKCKVVETGQPIQIETFYKGSGINGWFIISMTKLGNNGIVETYTDITESKLNKKTVERSAEKLHKVINTSQAGVFLGSPVRDENGKIIDFRFTMVNESLAFFTGQSADKLIGELGSRWFARYQSNGLFEILKETFETGISKRFDFYYEGYNANAWINIMTTKLEDEILGTFTDHTPIKELQKVLESNVEELKRSNANLEEFAYAASHDLKEPIRKVQIFSDLLKNSLATRLNEDETRLFERMENASTRMSLLIDDLLEYSQVSRGIGLIDDVDLNKKMKLVLADLELIIQEKNAQVIIDHLPIVKGHRRQMQQLFLNLIGNSLKYAMPCVAPKIMIRSKKVTGAESHKGFPVEAAGKRFHLIEVADNGIGFDQSDVQRIFNVFQRLHGNNEYKGTGVGLSIVRKVVENHHGYITAESKPGAGATFKVYLPVSS